jgi:hypothetical protein
MHGEDEHLNPDAWFVPVIVSEPRQDIDKCTFVRLFVFLLGLPSDQVELLVS